MHHKSNVIGNCCFSSFLYVFSCQPNCKICYFHPQHTVRPSGCLFNVPLTIYTNAFMFCKVPQSHSSKFAIFKRSTVIAIGVPCSQWVLKEKGETLLPFWNRKLPHGCVPPETEKNRQRNNKSHTEGDRKWKVNVRMKKEQWRRIQREKERRKWMAYLHKSSHTSQGGSRAAKSQQPENG